MDVHVSTGHWIEYLTRTMSENADTPLCFYLPSTAHVHAFLIVKEDLFPEKPFEFRLTEGATIK